MCVCTAVKRLTSQISLLFFNLHQSLLFINVVQVDFDFVELKYPLSFSLSQTPLHGPSQYQTNTRQNIMTLLRSHHIYHHYCQDLSSLLHSPQQKSKTKAAERPDGRTRPGRRSIEETNQLGTSVGLSGSVFVNRTETSDSSEQNTGKWFYSHYFSLVVINFQEF